MGDTRILTPPAGIDVLASSQHRALYHPHLERARHVMGQHACQGVRNGQ
jgi:LacI family transcriptional regulator